MLTNDYGSVPQSLCVAALTLTGMPFAIESIRTPEIAHFMTSASLGIMIKTPNEPIYSTDTPSQKILLTLETNTINDSFPAPKTEIARKLLEHRRKALSRGMTFLTAYEINLRAEEGRCDFS